MSIQNKPARDLLEVWRSAGIQADITPEELVIAFNTLGASAECLYSFSECSKNGAQKPDNRSNPHTLASRFTVNVRYGNHLAQVGVKETEGVRSVEAPRGLKMYNLLNAILRPF